MVSRVIFTVFYNLYTYLIPLTMYCNMREPEHLIIDAALVLLGYLLSLLSVGLESTHCCSGSSTVTMTDAFMADETSIVFSFHLL